MIIAIAPMVAARLAFAVATTWTAARNVSDGPNITIPARNAFLGRGSAESRSMRLGFFAFFAFFGFFAFSAFSAFAAFAGSGFFGRRRRITTAAAIATMPSARRRPYLVC